MSQPINILSDFTNHIDIATTMNGGVALTDISFRQRKGEIILKMNIPSLQPDDYHVEISDGVLKVYGIINQSGNYNKIATGEDELYASVVREFPIPPSVNQDAIEAIYEDDTLTIHLPYSKDRKADHMRVRRS